MIKKFEKIAVLLLLLTAFGQVLPIVIGSSIMEHPSTNKKIIFFDEAHASYIAHVADSRKLTALNSMQQKFLSKFAHELLNVGSETGARTIVITETGNNVLGSIFEQEAGYAKKDVGETIEIFPRMFLQEMFSSTSNPEQRSEIFNSKREPFKDVNTYSVVLNNKIRWIAGDRFRNKQDSYLASDIYKNLNGIKKWLATPASERDEDVEMTSLTVAAVKEYISQLHDEFEKNGINDAYYKPIFDTINEALNSKPIEGSTHFVFVHEYLLNKDGNGTLRDSFNNNMIKFLSQKFDLELAMYLDRFEKDENLSSVIVVAGAVHNTMLRDLLASKGYTVSSSAGIYDTRALEEATNYATMNALLDQIKATVPFVDTKKILGISTQKIIKNRSHAKASACF